MSIVSCVVLVCQVRGVRKEKIIVWMSSGQCNSKMFPSSLPLLSRLQTGFSALLEVKNKREEGRKSNRKCLWFNRWYKATSASAAAPLLWKTSVGETGCDLEVQSFCLCFLLGASPHPATASCLHTFFSKDCCLLVSLAPDSHSLLWSQSLYRQCHCWVA